MQDLHRHYDQLTDHEREAVDQIMRDVFTVAREDYGIYLDGGDEAERAADALARLIVQSRRFQAAAD